MTAHVLQLILDG